MAKLHSVDIDVQIEGRLTGKIEMTSAKEVLRLRSVSDSDEWNRYFAGKGRGLGNKMIFAHHDTCLLKGL